MNNKIKCLYYIKDLRTDKIIYIGKTIDFEHRKLCHFSDKRTPIDKYMFNEGRQNFKMNIFISIFCSNMSNKDLKNKENELILYYNTISNGFNRYRSGVINANNYTEYQREYQREYHRKYSKLDKIKEYQREYHRKYQRKN